jgi:hypothetical protein
MVLKKALFIGINYNGTSAQLSGCFRDAVNMSAHILTNHRSKGTVALVVSDPNRKARNRATAANIRAKLKWLTTGLSPGDSIFLHYSGHGGFIHDQQGEEKDSRDETIYPMDYQRAGHITDDELRRILVEKVPAGVTLIAIFDCCHSGTTLDLKNSYRWTQVGNKLNFTLVSNNNINTVPGHVILISGCKDPQYSYEAVIAGRVQGAMTSSFISTYNALKGGGGVSAANRRKRAIYGRLMRRYRRSMRRTRNRRRKRQLRRAYYRYRALYNQLSAPAKPITYKNLLEGIVSMLKKGGYRQDPQISTDDVLNLEEPFKL